MKINGKNLKEDTKYFAYDGCHKIYILESENDILEASEADFEIREISEIEFTFNNSCGLQFISNWNLDVRFIEQCSTANTFEIR